MIRKILKKNNILKFQKRFSIFDRIYGTTDIALNDYGEAYDHYIESLIGNYRENVQQGQRDRIDETLINDLRLLRGLRFGMDHTQKNSIEAMDIIRGRASVCEDDYLPKYLYLLNEIGFRDEQLYEAFFNSIKINFEGMKYTKQLKNFYYWTKSNLFIYSHEIEEKIKKRFFERSVRRFKKLEKNELAMLLWILNSWGVNIKELLEYTENFVDFNTLMTGKNFELNQFIELSYLLAQFGKNNEDSSSDLEDFSESQKNALKLIESFCVLSPIQYDNILRETDMKNYHDKAMGAFDPITADTSYIGFITCDLLGIEAREFNFHFEEIIQRKMEYDIIELNTAAKLVTLEGDKITADTKAQIYHGVGDVFENEASIVPISIFPENLFVLANEVKRDLDYGFISKVTLRRVAEAIVAFIARDEFDEHLSEIPDLDVFKALIKDEDLNLGEDVRKLALENVELNDF